MGRLAVRGVFVTVARPVVALAAVAALSACLSAAAGEVYAFDRAPLLGMVYDGRNEPCAAARITVDGFPGPATDINGRFLLQNLRRGTHAVEVRRSGYETLQVEVDFLDKSQVLYLKVVSLEELLARAEEALAGRHLGEAAALLARARAVDPASAELRYLGAVSLLRSGKPAAAAEALEAILAQGTDVPAVYLSLADIYQYCLEELGKAKAALTAYLVRQEDSEARRRLEGLEAEGD